MRKDMSYIRKLNITRSAELNSGNASDDFIHVDCNQKRITDYFNRISKVENLDSIERRSQKKVRIPGKEGPGNGRRAKEAPEREQPSS